MSTYDIEHVRRDYESFKDSLIKGLIFFRDCRMTKIGILLGTNFKRVGWKMW